MFYYWFCSFPLFLVHDSHTFWWRWICGSKCDRVHLFYFSNRWAWGLELVSESACPSFSRYRDQHTNTVYPRHSKTRPLPPAKCICSTAPLLFLGAGVLCVANMFSTLANAVKVGNHMVDRQKPHDHLGGSTRPGSYKSCSSAGNPHLISENPNSAFIEKELLYWSSNLPLLRFIILYKMTIIFCSHYNTFCRVFAKSVQNV